MAGMGPPPKDPDQRARRGGGPAMMRLPATGRQGTPPPWPLGPDVVLSARARAARARAKDLRVLAGADGITAREAVRRDRAHATAVESATVLEATVRAQRKRETDLWRELWATPMAVEWERLRWTREVAVYVRFHVRGETGDVKAAQEARLRGETLGLSPMSLLRLRWRIEDAAPQAVSGPASGARAGYRHLRVAPDKPTL
jgi:hypothetical protein